MFNYFLLFINFQHRSFQNIYFVLYTLLQNSEHSQLKDIFHLTLVMPGIYQYFLFIYFSFLLRSVTTPLCHPPPWRDGSKITEILNGFAQAWQNRKTRSVLRKYLLYIYLKFNQMLYIVNVHNVCTFKLCTVVQLKRFNEFISKRI